MTAAESAMHGRQYMNNIRRHRQINPPTPPPPRRLRSTGNMQRGRAAAAAPVTDSDIGYRTHDDAMQCQNTTDCSQSHMNVSEQRFSARLNSTAMDSAILFVTAALVVLNVHR